MKQQTGAISDQLLSQVPRRQVAPRDSSLVSRSVVPIESLESELAVVAEPTQAMLPSPRPKNGTLRETLQAELDSYPETSKKALHIRLAESLQEPFVTECRTHGCTPETFLEAVTLMLETDPHLKQRLLKDAQTIYQKRQKAGRLRRAMADLDKV